MKMKTVREALQYTADNPVPTTDPIDTPMWYLVCSELFHVANTPSVKVKGSMRRATAAQRLILNRLVGLRRSGSSPAVSTQNQVQFVDLTAGLLEAEEDAS
jgi:hypothetical protein